MIDSSTISTRRKYLSFDNGRVSAMRTMSPIFAELFSSCALYFLEYLIRLPYVGWNLKVSTWTVIVFSILSETTRPCNTLRLLRSSMDRFPPLLNFLTLLDYVTQF